MFKINNQPKQFKNFELSFKKIDPPYIIAVFSINFDPEKFIILEFYSRNKAPPFS